MEIFDKKFVRFMWDDELEGKECFVADEMGSLEKDVNIADYRIPILHYSGNRNRPFLAADGNTFRFAYYAPHYSIKKAFNEGKTIQFKLPNGAWEDILCEGNYAASSGD